MKNYKLNSALITIAIIAFSQFANAQSLNSLERNSITANLMSALHQSELKKDTIGIANAYENLGSYYAFSSKKDLAIISYGKADMMYKNVHDTSGIIASSFSASMIYFSKGKYYIGINGLLSVLNLTQISKDYAGMADCYANLGMGYYQLEQYDTALKYMKINLEISSKLKDQYKMMDAYKNLAKIYDKLGNQDQVVKYNQFLEKLNESVAAK